MPKKSSKDKILDISEKLFLSHGYDDTDMRLIAKESGIAIGTLYYHYKNKDELFKNVLDSIWGRISNQFDDVLNKGETPKEKLLNICDHIYTLALKKKQIGLESFIKSGSKNSNEGDCYENKITQIGELFKDHLVSLIRELDSSLVEDDLQRLATSIIFTILSLVDIYDDDSEKNKSFIKTYIDLLLKN